MKKLFVVVCSLLTVSAILSANFAILGRVGYFMPTAQTFKDVYGSSLMPFGGELRLDLSPALALWAEASYLSKSGQTTAMQDSTSIKIMPVEAGILYKLGNGSITPYAGAGFGLMIYNEESAVLGNTSASGFCASGLAGVTYHAGSILLDAKVKYQFCKVTADDGSINVGGIYASLGVGVAF